MANMFGRVQGIRRKQFTGRERIHNNVKKEDFLVSQIDEFKEKAQQLQLLLDEKEKRVAELQSIVDEREMKAKNLQEILQEKQLEVDKITEGVEGYAKQITKELQLQIEQLKGTFDERQAGDQEQLEKFAASNEGVLKKLDTMKGELSEKVHTENVKSYRNMQSLIEERETLEMGEKSMKVMKKYMKIVAAIGIVNLVALVALFLYEAGIINYFL